MQIFHLSSQLLGGFNQILIARMQSTQQSKPSTTITTIPDGFMISTVPNGQQYLVPQFMVPALDQAFVAYQHKWDLDVSNVQGGVSFHFQLASTHSCLEFFQDWNPFSIRNNSGLGSSWHQH